MKFYRVGGCVRDKLMGIKSNDTDIAVECNSFEEMTNEIKKRGGVIYLEKPEFLTARAKLNGEVMDFAMCRGESNYSDGRRPDKVIPTNNIILDLARRDFTINAIAENFESKEIIDPFGGQKDIENKLIRCVGSATDRFSEDSLRLIRAIRFSITKGFTLDNNIISALNDYIVVTGIINVSKERIREELLKCFAHDTYLTLFTLYKFPLLIDRLFDNNELWLKPTLEVK